ncbi:MAG: DNA replication/repair protein RecF [Chitinophagaceae bacterium]|nr:DNA replication/repair protein RecF [Chitinophagaceae bacterium]
MLQVDQLSITQFKNYTLSSFKFEERIIGICGLNGKGKTNLIDAIYYGCFTKSYFTKTDAFIAQFNSDGFRIAINFSKNNESQKLVCINKNTEKKELLLNNIPYNKFSEHIGKFPAVMIAPDDIDLITGGSEERRKFIDTIISQVNSTYLQQLILYNKILLQRNSLLKRFAEQGKTDWALLEVLDEQLLNPGNYIYTARKEFALQFIPLVRQFYTQISNSAEQINVLYLSQLHVNGFSELFNQFRQKDFITERTNAGIHKDDLLLEMNNQSFKNISSQGQRKSLLFALKLAEFEILKLNKGFAPLLLLDDVFEKLDNERMYNLLDWVSKKNDGQVFITDTHKERLFQSFSDLGIPYQIIEL